MAEFNDYSQKGSVLMQQALKKYAEGDFEGGDKDRAEANRWFDLAARQLTSEAGKMAMLYGESRNFGIIYNVFEQNFDKLLETKQGKNIIKEGYNIIKKSKVLHEQFKISDAFEKTNNVDNVKDFVNEASMLVKNYDRQTIMENNEKLISFIKEHKLDEYVHISEETENLYEAIEYIILNKKSFNNINNYIKAQKTISEHIEKNIKNKINETTNKEIFNEFEEKVDEAEKKIEENISAEEKKLLENFANDRIDKKSLFNEYKETTLRKVNEMIRLSEDEEDKAGWEELYEDVKSRTFSEDNTLNISNCAEMLEICDTIDE